MSVNNITGRIVWFAFTFSYEDLKPGAIAQLKKHLLDAAGSMLYAIKALTVEKMFRQPGFLQTSGSVDIPVLGNTSVDQAAQLCTLLVRYAAFMDNYLGKHATCYPRDNI
ncbi:MmgE/PrpD family protein [Chitinophaga sancti]|nr:MmgE/PrpD family protein [Chitinophaga sancti]WQD64669.1 MmgE/PrpD family protein [Chitinophaga sancti]WQG89709.1 MmgE/PrpD family protein [Chitinophaga sancti]